MIREFTHHELKDLIEVLLGLPVDRLITERIPHEWLWVYTVYVEGAELTFTMHDRDWKDGHASVVIEMIERKLRDALERWAHQ